MMIDHLIVYTTQAKFKTQTTRFHGMCYAIYKIVKNTYNTPQQLVLAFSQILISPFIKIFVLFLVEYTIFSVHNNFRITKFSYNYKIQVEKLRGCYQFMYIITIIQIGNISLYKSVAMDGYCGHILKVCQ